MIVLLGAEFTQAWAAAHGAEIEPEQGAIRISRAATPAATACSVRPGPLSYFFFAGAFLSVFLGVLQAI
jgi:hypothetical protein